MFQGKKLSPVIAVAILLAPISFASKCAGKPLSRKRSEVSVSVIAAKIWQRLKDLELIRPILKNSSRAGIPQFFSEYKIPDTDLSYEARFSTITFESSIRRIKRDAPFVLEIQGKFQPDYSADPQMINRISDHYTKTMMSYVMSRSGKNGRMSNSGFQELSNRLADIEPGLHQKIFGPGEEGGIDAWQIATDRIWAPISQSERELLVRHFLAAEKSHVYMGDLKEYEKSLRSPQPPSAEDSILSELERVTKQQKFVHEMETALANGTLKFSFYPETAALVAQP
jgi:hypothetical protein